MPVLPNEIVMYLSGGAANSDPDASIGGAISTTAFVTATPENLFSTVDSAEASAGSIRYRCVYIKNESATSDLINGGKYITQESPNTSTSIDIGLGNSGINGTETAIADDETPPAPAVTFTHPLTEGTKVTFGGDLTPDDHVPLWIRRTVQAGAPSIVLDNPITIVTGDTV